MRSWRSAGTHACISANCSSFSSRSNGVSVSADTGRSCGIARQDRQHRQRSEQCSVFRIYMRCPRVWLVGGESELLEDIVWAQLGAVLCHQVLRQPLSLLLRASAPKRSDPMLWIGRQHDERPKQLGKRDTLGTLA
eukprot:3359359-Rhodomonas_salina.1